MVHDGAQQKYVFLTTSDNKGVHISNMDESAHSIIENMYIYKHNKVCTGILC